MTAEEKTYRYKLDFYYQSALIYLVTLIAYGGIKGKLGDQKFEYVLNDPFLYIIVFFVVMSLIALGLNALRNRRLVLTNDAIIFRHRWADRRIPLTDIEWMHIGREPRVRTGGRLQVIVFKIKEKRRLYRIRVGRYERERDLVQQMHAIASRLPARKQRVWRRPRITDR